MTPLTEGEAARSAGEGSTSLRPAKAGLSFYQVRVSAPEAREATLANNARLVMVERPPGLRPIRRLETASWNGRPVHESDAQERLVDAGFVVDDDRLVYTRDQAFRAPA